MRKNLVGWMRTTIVILTLVGSSFGVMGISSSSYSVNNDHSVSSNSQEINTISYKSTSANLTKLVVFYHDWWGDKWVQDTGEGGP